MATIADLWADGLAPDGTDVSDAVDPRLRSLVWTLLRHPVPCKAGCQTCGTAGRGHRRWAYVARAARLDPEVFQQVLRDAYRWAIDSASCPDLRQPAEPPTDEELADII